MSVNFPFILLGIIQLAPEQAIALAALSVFAQCRFKVLKPFTFIQIAFNVANVIVSTAMACATFLFYTRIHVELAPALALAAGVYFFVNTLPVALVIGWSKGEPALLLWRREFPVVSALLPRRGRARLGRRPHQPAFRLDHLAAAHPRRLHHLPRVPGADAHGQRPTGSPRRDRSAPPPHHRGSRHGHRGQGPQYPRASAPRARLRLRNRQHPRPAQRADAGRSSPHRFCTTSASSPSPSTSSTSPASSRLKSSRR